MVKVFDIGIGINRKIINILIQNPNGKTLIWKKYNLKYEKVKVQGLELETRVTKMQILCAFC